MRGRKKVTNFAKKNYSHNKQQQQPQNHQNDGNEKKNINHKR